MTFTPEPRHGGGASQTVNTSPVRTTAGASASAGFSPVVKTGEDFRAALASMKTLDELAGVDLAFEIAAVIPSAKRRAMIATGKAEIELRRI